MNGLTPLRRSAGADYPSALADLTDRHRRAKGELRRLLASRLIVEHEPLLHVLVDKLQGREVASGKRQRRTKGADGFEVLEREECLQAARIACVRALDKFNPAKGKWTPYLLWWVLSEIQRGPARDAHLARVPQGKESLRAEVELVEDWSTAPHATCPDILEDLGELDGLTREELDGWAADGDYPDSLEAWQASLPVEPEPSPRPALERILTVLRFGLGGRVPNLTLLGRWHQLGGTDGATLRTALRDRGARPCTMRTDWAPATVRGWAGVTIDAHRAV